MRIDDDGNIEIKRTGKTEVTPKFHNIRSDYKSDYIAFVFESDNKYFICPPRCLWTQPPRAVISDKQTELPVQGGSYIFYDDDNDDGGDDNDDVDNDENKNHNC